jgi:hypothetical protein
MTMKIIKYFHTKLKKLGFEPPEPGGRHFYMRYGTHTLPIQNNSEYSVPQLKMLLKEVECIFGKKISLDEWGKI